MQAGQKFLDFLRKWRNGQVTNHTKIIKAEAPAVFFVAKKQDNALNMVVARHLGNGSEHDHDDASAKEWQSKLSRWENEIMGVLDSSLQRQAGARRDHFNFESSPAANLGHFIAKKKKSEPDPDLLLNKPWFAQAVTAGAFALILAVALGKMNIGLVQRINSYTDRLFVDPVISAAFLFGSQETLANIGIDEIPEQYRSPEVIMPLDKNIMSSFIVNNSRRLKTGNASEASFSISPEHLDGRVAGAFETETSQPSAGLIEISAVPKTTDLIKAKVGQALLDLANLQIKLSDKAYEYLTGSD